MKFKSFSILTILFSLIVFCIFIAVEIMNYQAGGILPNKEGGKLRYSPLEWENGWRDVYSSIKEDASLEQGRKLSAHEYSQFKKDQDLAVKRNRLINATSSWALFQYILCPLALCLSLIMIKRNEHKLKTLGICLVCANLTSLVFLIWRGYFND